MKSLLGGPAFACQYLDETDVRDSQLLQYPEACEVLRFSLQSLHLEVSV